MEPPYIEGNPSTAFAARLIPQYESHIRVTKETIPFVVNLTKEIPHSNHVTKERTPKLSQHISHQGTVRTRVLNVPCFPWMLKEVLTILTSTCCDFLAPRECPAKLICWVRRWAGDHEVRFRFNGRVSKPYFVKCGIPQGSPLSPFVFGAYVADIFEPRLRYSPSVRTVVSSYVDDVVILLASDSRDLTRYMMAEIFPDCDRVGRGRKMGFSTIKTRWIGFGGTAWEDLDIDGELLTPVEDLRVLGYRFNVFLNMSSHVSYWLERGLGVRSRISALGRRFGSDGGLDAWCTYRLFQAAYLPTVYFGLESATDFSSYVKRF